MTTTAPEPGQIARPSFAENVSVVLVHPQHSLNIGSVARAMLNLGFSNLVLVKPEEFNMQKASVTARWATPIVEQATTYEDLNSALENFTDVIGFGGRYDGENSVVTPLPSWIRDFQPQEKKIALVFGPEDRGLNTAEIHKCRQLVRIPSTADYPSYNLAQSVLLVLYELSRTQWEANLVDAPERAMPTQNEFFQLDRMLDEILTATGFFREGTPAPIPGIIQRLFRRMRPDEREMGILLAMVSKIGRHIKREKARGDATPPQA